MKIAFITSWHQKCGIAQYSEWLVKALISLGHEVKVIANIPYEAMTDEDEPYVSRLFNIELRDKKNHFDFKRASEIINTCDVVHVQGESALYSGNYLPQLQAMTHTVPWVVTYHSTCAPKLLPRVAMHTAHTEQVLDQLGLVRVKRATIQMPCPVVDYVPPPLIGGRLLIGSYGLGRNHDDLVNKAVFEVNDSKEKNQPELVFHTHYGHHKWLPYSALLRWIQEQHACILYYPPVGASVSSSAAYLSLACGRPLIVSTTNWFSALSGDHVIFGGCSAPELVTALVRLRDYYSEFVEKSREYAEYCKKNRSFVAVAKKLELIYAEARS
jgi:glycosyltransferase involved in cell wall biosynthesis